MYHFIVNVHGGNGKALLRWKNVQKILKKKNIEYKAWISYKKGYATTAAQKISSLPGKDIKIVVVGGDGTINEVLNGIKDFSKILFGVIPTGSGNDFSRGVGIPRHNFNLRRNLEKILQSKCNRFMDIGKVTADNLEPRYFGISSGIGLDAIVCKKCLNSRIKFLLNCLHLGNLVYMIYTIQTLFSMKKNKIRATFDNVYTQDFERLIFLASMNLRAEGGGVKMAPKANHTDGKLSICAADSIPKVLTFFTLPFLVCGLHTKFKGFHLRDFRKLEIQSQEPLVLHTDGEYVGDVKHIVFQSIPAGLRLLM